MEIICAKCRDKRGEIRNHPVAHQDLCFSYNIHKLGCYQDLSEKINDTITNFFKFKIARGEHNKNSKITESQVKELKKLFKTKEWTIRELAEKFNISEGNVYCIKSGKTWAHIKVEDE